MVRGSTIPCSRSTVVFAGLGVVGGEERVVGAVGFEVRNEVPEGSCLVEVAYGRHV